MSEQPIGNEQQMAEVRASMLAAKTAQGGNLQEGVHIEFTSLDGTVYDGWIVFKRPNMLDYMQMGAIKSEFFRRAGVQDMKLIDESINFMAHVMSVLEVVMLKRPEWLLNVQAVKEPELLYHVYGKYNEWEGAFRKDFRQPSTPNSESIEGTEAVDTSEVRL